jgi:hypothetical protein
MKPYSRNPKLESGQAWGPGFVRFPGPRIKSGVTLYLPGKGSLYNIFNKLSYIIMGMYLHYSYQYEPFIDGFSVRFGVDLFLDLLLRSSYHRL